MPRFSTYAELQAFLAELGAGDDSLFTGGVAETPSNMLLNTLPATRTAVATSTVLPSSNRQAVRVTAKAIDTIKTLNVTSQASTATQLLTKEQIDSLLLGAALNVPASATDGKWLANSQGTSLFNSTMWSNQPPARLAVVLEAPSGIYGKAIATGVYTNLPSYKVYYTLDGSEPTDKSLTIAQNEKIQINGDVSTNVTLKVLVVDTSGLTDNFGRTEATYTIEEYIDISTSAYWVNAGVGQPTQMNDGIIDWSWWQQSNLQYYDAQTLSYPALDSVGHYPTNPQACNLILFARKAMYWTKLKVTARYTINNFELGDTVRIAFFSSIDAYNNISTPVISFEETAEAVEATGELTVTLNNSDDFKLESYSGIQLLVTNNGVIKAGTITMVSTYIALKNGTEASFIDTNNLGWTTLGGGGTDPHEIGNWMGYMPGLPQTEVPGASGIPAEIEFFLTYNTIASQQLRITIEDIPRPGFTEDSEYLVIVNGFRLLNQKLIDDDELGDFQASNYDIPCQPAMGSKRAKSKTTTTVLTIPLIAGAVSTNDRQGYTTYGASDVVGLGQVIICSRHRNFYVRKIELSEHDDSYLRSLYKGYGPDIHTVGEPYVWPATVYGKDFSVSNVFDLEAYIQYATLYGVTRDDYLWYHAFYIAEGTRTRHSVNTTYTIFEIIELGIQSDFTGSVNTNSPKYELNIRVYAMDPKTSTDRYIQLGQYNLVFEFP